MAGSLAKIFRNWGTFFRSRKLISNLRTDLENLKSRLDVPPELFDRFFTDRCGDDYQAAYTRPEPLVTVCIATYNRGRLLTERSIPSVLNQTYRNLELLVVGDCCIDDTAERVAAIRDPRLHFINLAERGRYPENPQHRWCVAGSVPMNHALSLARGDFITHLDDDDEFPLDRTEKLLAFIRRERADLVWHPFWKELPDGSWKQKKAHEYEYGKVTTSSIFYHRWFTVIPWDLEAYRFNEPGDWNRLRKFKYLGAKVARYPEPLLRHYRERNQGK